MGKSLHLFISLFLMLLYVSLQSHSFSHEVDECSLLLDFKNKISTNYSAFGDPRSYPKLASWNLNTSEGKSYCCLWDGVECSDKTSGHVIVLDLSSSFLYGTINSTTTLFSLIHLRTLNLADNDFRSSQIPSGIGHLSQLATLDLSFCHFSGEFPTSVFLLPKLQLLNLQFNSDLTGYLPKFHGNSHLKSLVLAGTKFQGMVPPSIGNLIHLERLDMLNCFFTGPLPGSVGNLTHLTYLSLYNNKFTGKLPSLESLSNLVSLSLANTNFDRWKLPDWFGKLNKLTTLRLAGVNLYGQIPSSIFNLTQLETLNLVSNQIEGPIPPFPSTMTRLTILDLADNQLRGPIPSSLSHLKNLELVFLSNNNISGTVEVDIFLYLKKLKVLQLGGNKITLSAINTTTITTLPKLEMLGLEPCNLRVFPDFLRFQDQLESLNLDNNKIDGVIPKWMENTSKETLQVLSLSRNSLTGFEKRSSVVPWIGLSILDLSHNMLQGFIPVPSPTTIIFMVSNNTLTGEIPPSICELQSLQVLDLSLNNVTGSITPCLKKLSNSLLVLNLRGNAIQGTIPNIFNNGSNLQVINLSENQLEGHLPRSLENCASLMILDLRGNTLRGTVPNIFTNGGKLQMIDLSENELEGQLPRSLENCTSLQILNLGNNHIEDMFPFWLGALSKLRVLILRFNKFHGAIWIPSKTNSKLPKLHIIDLSHNSFYGNLPNQYFEEWLAMKETESNGYYMHPFNLTVRKYSYSMKFVNKGVNMKYEKIINNFIAIDLSSNKFKGMIPESIKSLSGLRSLNLSNNELSGPIPSSMRNLTLLESLDLSSNKLSGRMPQELTQLNFLELLNVSYNNLDGLLPQGGQFNTFSNISYMGNLALCGDPLSKKCGNSETSQSLAVSLNKGIEYDFPIAVDWVVILLGVASGLVIGLLFGNHLAKIFYESMLQRFIKRD